MGHDGSPRLATLLPNEGVPTICSGPRRSRSLVSFSCVVLTLLCVRAGLICLSQGASEYVFVAGHGQRKQLVKFFVSHSSFPTVDGPGHHGLDTRMCAVLSQSGRIPWCGLRACFGSRMLVGRNSRVSSSLYGPCDRVGDRPVQLHLFLLVSGTMKGSQALRKVLAPWYRGER